MRRLAPRWIAYQRRIATPRGITALGTSSSSSGQAAGVPVLVNTPGPSTNIVVEIAWGANRANPSSTWAWTDVTADVQVDNNKTIQIFNGRNDWRSVAGPATFSCTLDNRANLYSKSPTNPNYPNVKRGVPLRCRVIRQFYSQTQVVMFQGEVSAFTPSFDETGRYAIVNVAANGVLRRLSQGDQPLQSTLRLYTPNVTSLVAYWPMEDASGATQFASAVPGGTPMSFAGTTSLHSSTTLVGSSALPVFAGYTWGAVTPYTPTNAVQLRAVVAWPAVANALPDKTPVLRLFCSGSIAWYDITYGTGGTLQVTAHSAADGSTVYDSGAIAFAVDGTAGQLSLQLAQSGANIAGTISTLTQTPGAAGSYTNFTINSQTITTAVAVQVLPTNGVASTQLALGHITVQAAVSDIFENSGPLQAYAGEFANSRLGRLLTLIGAEAAGFVTDGTTNVARMGPQGIDTALNLIRECETTDAGWIVDGFTASVAALSHSSAENISTSTANTIDMTAGYVVQPFSPVDDDLLIRNQWVEQQRNGSTYTAVDATGPQGTQAVGLYHDTETVNLYTNPLGTNTGAFGQKALQDRGQWRLHQTTPDGYRFPNIELALHNTPAGSNLINDVLYNQAVYGMYRWDVKNLSSVYPQLPPGVNSLLSIGVGHVIGKFTWFTTLVCVPYDVYRIGVLAQASGDTGEFVERLDTSGSQVTTLAPVGAASLSVATTSGPLWTTDSDDVPLTISVGGIQVTVTAISGSSSPQTFTVDPATVTVPLQPGTAVNVYRPGVLGIGGTS